MADLRELEEINDSTNQRRPPENLALGEMRRAGPAGFHCSDAVPPVPGEGPGISITRTSKVGDQLVMRY